MNEKDFYAVVLKSGQFAKQSSLEEMKKLNPDMIECYLFARYDRVFVGPSNRTEWFQFAFVDADGNPNTYKVGDFEVSYIGTDSGYTNFFGRQITIHDIQRDKYHKYSSGVWYHAFVTNEIKPLLEKLNNCSSEEEIEKVIGGTPNYYQLEQKCNNLERELERYKDIALRVKDIVNTL